jgi:hypothetical protein
MAAVLRGFGERFTAEELETMMAAVDLMARAFAKLEATMTEDERTHFRATTLGLWRVFDPLAVWRELRPYLPGVVEEELSSLSEDAQVEMLRRMVGTFDVADDEPA